MKRKIIYFINPISGTKGKEALLKRIEERTKEQGISYEILHTNPTGNYYFLKEKIDEEYITDIVICGGDGTVNQVVSYLLESDVKVGIIPMGSGNGLAFAAGIPKQPEKALELIFTGKAAYIDAFFINDKFSCMLCGLGFDAQVAHDFSKQSKRGLATYVKQTMANFVTARPYRFEVINRGKSFATDAYFISIANSNQFGNNVTIAPKASLNDGLLDIVVAGKMNKAKLIWSLLRQIRKGQVKNPDENSTVNGVLYFQTDKLIIHNLDQAPLHIDGDPAHTAKKFVIDIISDAFKLIQPVS